MILRLTALLFSLLLGTAYAQTSGGGPTTHSPTMSVTDGTTTCYPYQLMVGSVTSCTNGVATIATAGGSGNIGIGTSRQEAVYIGTTSVGSGIITDTGTNVGIGTISPLATLEVVNNNSFSAGTGGTITTYISGGVTYKVHTFTSGGTFVAPSPATNVTYLLVAGGGAGGYNGGGAGGAGGLLTGTSTLTASGSYTITIGAAGTANSNPGSNSTFNGLTAIGGGAGSGSGNGGSGGSGGGAYYNSGTGGSGTSGQGYAGGNGGCGGSGGGGGAGGAGSCTSGGAGVSSSITGTSITYAPGGAGWPGTGGAGANATLYGGGGGGGGGNANGGNGYQGVAIFSYAVPSISTAIYSKGGLIVNTATQNGVLTVQGSGNNSLTSTITASNSSGANTFTVLDNGNVGIGSTNPGQELDVNGTARMTGFNLSTSPTNGYVLTSDANGNGTWSVSSGSTGPNTATITTTNSQIQADSGTHSGQYGYVAWGDSVTSGVGVTNSLNSWVQLVAAHTNSLAGLDNLGIPANTSCDVSYSALYNANPSDWGNPLYTTDIGFNDAGGTPSTVKPVFQKCQYAADTWLALSSTNKILAGNAAVTATGSWSADTTFANANGETSSTANNTLSYPASIGTSGAFYVLYMMTGTDSTFTVSIDGTVATDTITNASTIHTAYTADAPVNEPKGVGAARYVTTNGSHTILVTVVSGSVTILAFEFPPTNRFRGMNAPFVVVGNLWPYQNLAGNQGNHAAINGYILSDVQTMISDGLDTPLADLSTAVDPYLDMAGSATQNCAASTSPGAHPNDCGHRHIAGVFESLLGATSGIISGNYGGPYTMAGPLQVSNSAAISNSTQFFQLNPHSYVDTLIAGLNISPWANQGIKAANNLPNTEYGTAIYADNAAAGHEIAFGWAAGNNSTETSEGNWTYPFWMTPDGTFHATNLAISGTTGPTTLPGPLQVQSGAAASNVSSGFSLIGAHSYTDTLIGGIVDANFSTSGMKFINDSTYGYGNGIFTDSIKFNGIGFSSGNNTNQTAESGFSWPYRFYSSYASFNENLGIGVTTPGEALDVQGTLRDTSEIINGNVGIGTSIISSAALTVNGGNVGIGTWLPNQLLVINNGNIAVGNQANNQLGGFGGGGIAISNGNGYFEINGAGNGTKELISYQYPVNGAEVAQISCPNGPIQCNIGLYVPTFMEEGNATVPQFQLDTYGNLTTTGNVGIGTTYINNAGEGALNVMGGNVGIGTWVPGQKLDVLGTVRGISAGTCTTLYRCVGGVDAGVIQTSACNLCPSGSCTAMNGCF